MQKAITWLAVIVTLVVVGKIGLERLVREGDLRAAHERVQQVFEGYRAGGDMNRSVAMWAEGVRVLPGGQGEFDAAFDKFNVWARKMRLSRDLEFEIVDSRIEQEGNIGFTVVLVDVRIDGQDHTLRAQKGQPLEWVK